MIIKSLLLVPDQSIYHLMEKVKMEGGLMTPPPLLGVRNVKILKKSEISEIFVCVKVVICCQSFLR